MPSKLPADHQRDLDETVFPTERSDEIDSTRAPEEATQQPPEEFDDDFSVANDAGDDDSLLIDANPATESAAATDIDQTIDHAKERHTRPAANDATFLPAENDVDPDATRAPASESALQSGSFDDSFSVDETRDSGLAQAQSNDQQSVKTARYKGAVKRIGRYEVIRLLGEGAFGYVFEARDPQLDRIVAIKVAKSLTTRTDVERFLREARLAAQLRHPNIVPVHEYGQVEDRHIIVYEFIAGETLKSYIKRKHPLPLEETLSLIRQIAEGLDYAHSKGIIHRDMKPDNVLIDDSGQPHIADFGCARSMDADVSLTMDGSIMGTPTYMSPEQASGRSNVADGRTDIWSLGVMLYEMVSGQKPFTGKLTDLLYWIRNHDATPLRKVEPNAPLDIETICKKCLQRELPDRFQRAQELADEIERYERGEPILSRPIGLFRRTWLWSKRNPAVASLLGLVAVILIVATTVSSLFAWKAWREEVRRLETQMHAIRSADPEGLPIVFDSLKESAASVLPKLKQQLNNNSMELDDRLRVRTAVINLDTDPAVKHQLSLDSVDDLLKVDDVGEFMLVRSQLRDQSLAIANCLWPVALDPEGQHSSDERFRAASLLTRLDPEAEHWSKIAADIVGHLVNLNDLEVADWTQAFTNHHVLDSIRQPLEDVFTQRDVTSKTSAERASALLATLFAAEPSYLIGLLESAVGKQTAVLINSLQRNRNSDSELPAIVAELETRLSELQKPDSELSSSNKVNSIANLRVALNDLSPRPDWSFFKAGRNPAVAAEVVERMGVANVDFRRLEKTLLYETPADPDVLSRLILSLGQFSEIQGSPGQRLGMRPWLLEQFESHPSPHVHSSAAWLLRLWGFVDEVATAEEKLRSRDPQPGFNWHVDLDGNTFVIFDPVDRFAMGTTSRQMQQIARRSIREYNEPLHDRSIPRRFGICTREVTIAQFLRFEDYLIARWTAEQQADDTSDDRKELLSNRLHRLERSSLRKPVDNSLPVTGVDYLQTLGYCRWASAEFDGGAGLVPVEKLQMAYEQGKALPIREKFITRTGYRLPTNGEWEYACRAGTHTMRPWGDQPDRTLGYAWCWDNSQRTLHPPGMLKPNPAGLFDMLGNASEWCLNWYSEPLPDRPAEELDEVWIDFSDQLNLRSATREFRGGSFKSKIEDLRSAKRSGMAPNMIQTDLGFRLARTYPEK